MYNKFGGYGRNKYIKLIVDGKHFTKYCLNVLGDLRPPHEEIWVDMLQRLIYIVITEILMFWLVKSFSNPKHVQPVPLVGLAEVGASTLGS